MIVKIVKFQRQTEPNQVNHPAPDSQTIVKIVKSRLQTANKTKGLKSIKPLNRLYLAVLEILFECQERDLNS